MRPSGPKKTHGFIEKYLHIIFIFFCFSILLIGNEELINPPDSGELSLEVVTNDLDSPKIHTVWTSIEEPISEVTAALNPQNIDSVKIITNFSHKKEAEALKEKLDNSGVRSEVVALPENIVEVLTSLEVKSSKAISSQWEAFKKWWKERRVAPTNSELTLGITSGFFRLGVSATIWLSVGVNPAIAATLITAQTATTVATRIWVRTADNIFANRSNSENKTKKSFLINEFLRRQTYELSLAELWRLISGPIRNAHSAFSLEGQLEILANVVASGTGFSVVSTARNKYLSRKASNWIGFYTYLLGITFQMLDLAGFHFYKIADFGFFDLNLSTALISGSLIGSALAIKLKPKLMERLSEMSEKLFSKGINKLRQIPSYFKFSKRNCAKVFSELSE